MISCPNCGKSVADEAVHCGHCGHKIEVATNQKTMMGFSLSPEDLQKAIAEAGQQRAAQAAEPVVDDMGRTEILPSINSDPALSDTLDPESDISAEAERMAAESPFGSPSAMPGMANSSQNTEPLSGFGPAPTVQDPFSQPTPSFGNQPMAPMPQANLQNMQGGPMGDGADEQSFFEKNKKVLLIVGIVVALLFGCCVISTIVQFVM